MYRVEVREGGRVAHLGALLRDRVLVLLLFAARATAGHGRGRGGGLVHDEARVALLGVPLEAGEVRLLELVVCLKRGISEGHMRVG
jgi:hypothetical protein